MTPAATGGPPSRTTVLNGGGPVTTSNGMKTNGLDGLRGVNRVYPHLEDLVNVKPDIDINAPLRQILLTGELFAKQADTHLDFRRPDVALQEYVKALIVATELLPRHKDWPSLQADRGELHRLFVGLKKRINTQHDKFDGVKELIKENNERSGAKPMLHNGTSHPTVQDAQGKTHSRSHSVQSPYSNGTSAVSLNGARHGADTNTVAGPGPRKRPPVQPKPDALHGNVINAAGNKPLNSSQADLAARFARLRGSESPAAVQDPRIRTYPISIPEDSSIVSDASSNGSQDLSHSPKPIGRPSGPRAMPSVPLSPLRSAKAKLPIDVNVPTMPKAPDAIYSPARGSDTAATINFPSSTPRGSYVRSSSRQNSISSMSNFAGTPTPVDDSGEYFSPAHATADHSHAPVNRTSQVINFPADKVDITAGELVNLLKLFRILLVDIRTREEFDSGHIMTQNIICVEPITIRPNMSAEELEESIVLAPDSEQELFKRRHEYDLIVYYNQSSCQASTYGPAAYKSVLEDFSRAIYEYGYEKKLKRRPVLLYGGLEAWIDVMGPGSLQSSETGLTASNSSTAKPARPLGRVPMARDIRKLAAGRRKAYESRLLSAEEESIWDAKLKVENRPTNPEIDAYYVKTTEDFFRKFPEVSVQESMVLSTPVDRISRQLDDAHQRELASTMPPVPARPPPALPRQSFSGVSDKVSSGPVMMAAQRTDQSRISSISAVVVPHGLTGLYNFGSTCYMNAVIQCLSATAPLRKFLLAYRYPDQRPPKKLDEATDHPQLMVRNVGNLFRYLWNGQYVHITPRTFSEYVLRLHGNRFNRDRRDSFGGPNQQDAQEFLGFCLEILSDELNPFRNKNAPQATEEEDAKTNKLAPIQAADYWWTRHRNFEGSMITDNLEGLQMSSIVCKNCNRISRTTQAVTFISITIPEGVKQMTLADGLANLYNTETLDDFECPQCRKNGMSERQLQLCRLPRCLIIVLNRFRFQQSAGKLRTTIDFPKQPGEYLDMTPYFIQVGPEDPEVPNLDPGIQGPFRYECYGFVKHIGRSVQSGHYVAETLFEEGNSKTWYDFNDTRVKVATHDDLQESPDKGDPYILFFKRQGV